MFLKRIRNSWRRIEAKEQKGIQDTKIPDSTAVIGPLDNVSIGNQVSFGGDVVLYANGKITIGDNTMIGMRTIIHTSTHDHQQHPMWRYRVDRPISIGQHVWIGASCIIQAGIIIEDYAVVAAGSVVTANVPKGAIVGGNPARIISHRDPALYNGTLSIQLWAEALPKEETYLNKWCKER